MELRTVDPRALLDNPNNPRGKLPPDWADAQLEASIREHGILQPPVARNMAKGLTIRWGSRRLRAALALELPQIPVLVLGPEDPEAEDEIRALLENVARKNMTPVDQWRAIERLASGRWTEEAIACALALDARTVRKLRLLGRLHPPMLDRMHLGDMPNERDLRVIASADLDRQAAAWKKHKPKKSEAVSWWQLAQALAVQRMRAADALFDAEFAAAYGVEYVEDLFAPAGEDSRATTNVDGFLAAQAAWVEAHLPENGVVLKAGQYGGPELPPKARRFYGKPGTGGGRERVGYFLDGRTGKVEAMPFVLPEPAGKGASGKGTDGAPTLPAKPRADLTQKGVAMVGDMRTDALHAALRDNPIDDPTLLALLVLALAGQNVSVRSGVPGLGGIGGRTAAANRLVEGGAITSDPDTLRQAAREALVHTLSCRDNDSQSGLVARLAGERIGADAHLPNMATPDFLACLSKAAVERAATGEGVAPEPTGKATRAALIRHVGQGRYVHPAATFGLTADELAAARERRRIQRGYGGAETDAGDDGAEDGAAVEAVEDEAADFGPTDEADDAGRSGVADDEPDGDGDPDTADARALSPARRRRTREGGREARAA